MIKRNETLLFVGAFESWMDWIGKAGGRRKLILIKIMNG